LSERQDTHTDEPYLEDYFRRQAERENRQSDLNDIRLICETRGEERSYSVNHPSLLLKHSLLVKEIRRRYKEGKRDQVNVIISCWSNDKELEIATRQISVAVLCGNLSLNEAQICISPDCLVACVQEISQMIRSEAAQERCKDSIFNIRDFEGVINRDGLRVAGLYLRSELYPYDPRIRESRSISKDDFYAFFGYASWKYPRLPRDLKLLLNEYFPVMIPYVLAFWERNITLGELLKIFDLENFEDLVRWIALIVEKHPAEFQCKSFRYNMHDEETLRIRELLYKHYKLGNFSATELMHFLGTSSVENARQSMSRMAKITGADSSYRKRSRPYTEKEIKAAKKYRGMNRSNSTPEEMKKVLKVLGVGSIDAANTKIRAMRESCPDLSIEIPKTRPHSRPKKTVPEEQLVALEDFFRGSIETTDDLAIVLTVTRSSVYATLKRVMLTDLQRFKDLLDSEDAIKRKKMLAHRLNIFSEDPKIDFKLA